MNEKSPAQAAVACGYIGNPSHAEAAHASGVYYFECYDAEGNLKWKDQINNLVTTQGGNYLLDTGLRSQVAITAWFIGLISSVGYTAVAIGDTAAQINGTNGWKEAGPTNAPNYGTARPALTVAVAASAKTLTASAPSSYTFSNGGTIKGAFLGSASAKDAVTGSLYSAGLFAGGDRLVALNDQINVTYAASV